MIFTLAFEESILTLYLGFSVLYQRGNFWMLALK